MKFNTLLVCVIGLIMLLYSAVNKAEEIELSIPDYVLEYEIYKEAARTGFPYAKLDLFLHVYENQPLLDDKVEYAIEVLESSAQQGHTPSQHMLGMLQINGDLLAKNVNSGRQWLLLAAESGYGKASFRLGSSYATEFYDTPKEEGCAKRRMFEQAERWLSKASTLNSDSPDISVAARVVLGRLYISRSIDDDRGWRLLSETARAGSAEATETLEALEDVLESTVKDGNPKANTMLVRVRDILKSLSQ